MVRVARIGSRNVRELFFRTRSKLSCPSVQLQYHGREKATMVDEAA